MSSTSRNIVTGTPYKPGLTSWDVSNLAHHIAEVQRTMWDMDDNRMDTLEHRRNIMGLQYWLRVYGIPPEIRHYETEDTGLCLDYMWQGRLR